MNLHEIGGNRYADDLAARVQEVDDHLLVLDQVLVEVDGLPLLGHQRDIREVPLADQLPRGDVLPDPWFPLRAAVARLRPLRQGYYRGRAQHRQPRPPGHRCHDAILPVHSRYGRVLLSFASSCTAQSSIMAWSS